MFEGRQHDSGAVYLTNVAVSSTEDDFRLTLASYSASRAFVCSPKHAKRMYLLLKTKIEEYEQRFGQLKTDLPPARKDKEAVRIGFKTEKAASRNIKRS